jgi:quinol monooxygenase YgiN
MIIVAGSLHVAPEHRAAYLEGCEAVVAAARAAPGCLDFALSGDLLDGGRVNVFERWDSAASLERFRGSGPDEGQLAVLREIRVSEYEIAR